jgi:hypothetical protein
MAIWLPGYKQHVFGNRQGFQYRSRANPKLCWHTTEGSSVAGALAAYAPYPPHLIVNPNTNEKLQHIPLDLAAYSAMDSNDREHIIQVEVVGFAGQSHNWSEYFKKWLGENVVRPIRDAVGVPDEWLRFYGEGEGIILASPNSPIRLSMAKLQAYTGHVGHQQLPAPDSHWDPGRMDIAGIVRYSQGGEDDMAQVPQAEWEDLKAKVSYMAAGKGGGWPAGQAFLDELAWRSSVSTALVQIAEDDGNNVTLTPEQFNALNANIDEMEAALVEAQKQSFEDLADGFAERFGLSKDDVKDALSEWNNSRMQIYVPRPNTGT